MGKTATEVAKRMKCAEQAPRTPYAPRGSRPLGFAAGFPEGSRTVSDDRVSFIRISIIFVAIHWPLKNHYCAFLGTWHGEACFASETKSDAMKTEIDLGSPRRSLATSPFAGVCAPRRSCALWSLFLGISLNFGIWNLGVAAPVRGWLSWRGPQQNGASLEKNLPDKLTVNDALWVADFPGQSTPVIANGRLYIMGYLGEGPDLQEGVACFDAETGKKLWQRLYNDFLSDTVYQRYATSSATVDPETGNVFMQGTQGILAAFDADGKLLWHHSLMEEFGRLTFPNSRTASPLIDQDLVITRGITANWGAQGPAADRFYAFDKKTGELVWASNPGDRPKDNSYSHPYLGWLGGRRVFYTATGDGSVVCVNALTGDPLWRVPLFKAGINATVLVHNKDKIIAVYGTPYEPGQMVALKILDVAPTNAAAGPVVLERSKVELWADDYSTSASSS